MAHFVSNSPSDDHEMVFLETAPTRPGHTPTLCGLEPYILNKSDLQSAGLRMLSSKTWDTALPSLTGTPFQCVPKHSVIAEPALASEAQGFNCMIYYQLLCLPSLEPDPPTSAALDVIKITSTRKGRSGNSCTVFVRSRGICFTLCRQKESPLPL